MGHLYRVEGNVVMKKYRGKGWLPCVEFSSPEEAEKFVESMESKMKKMKEKEDERLNKKRKENGL